MRRVRQASARRPPVYREHICGTCGHEHKVINGAYLRWRRERAGLDQRTFAARLGLSGPYLSDLERNRRDCPPLILRAYERLGK